MATFETKFGLGDKVWVLNFTSQPAKKCKHCGHGEPQYGYEVRKVKIVRVNLELNRYRDYRHIPSFSWVTTSGRKDRGFGAEDEFFATRAEALKALKRKQRKRK